MIAESITVQSYELAAPKRLAGLGEKPGVTVTIADVAEELTA